MAELKEVELVEIRPNRLNPRLDMNIERLNKLAESIRQVGLLEPIVVRPVGGKYEVVVGERRYRASQQAGLQSVPVVVRDFSDEQVIALNLIENIQREDLSAVEKGNCCKELLEKFPDKYPSREVVGKKVGVSADTISNWLKLTEAPVEIRRIVAPVEKAGVSRDMGKLDYSTALTITRQIPEPERQVEVAREIARMPVHGRKVRQIIAKVAEEPERRVEDILKELVEEPYELSFAVEDRDPILKGLKTQTTRVKPLDSGIKVGSVIRATVWEPNFANLRVVSIERKRLKYFTDEDAKAEGGYVLKDFRRLWNRMHGEWDESQLVYVMRFEKI